MTETLKELLDFNMNYVLDMYRIDRRKELAPMIIVSVNGKTNVFVVAGDVDFREGIRMLISKLSEQRLDWMVTINEGYMKVIPKGGFNEEEYKHGTLAEKFLRGDKDVKEIISIMAYKKKGKLARVLDKETMKPIEKDMEDFSGYLTASDIDRVVNWRDDDEI